MQSGIRTIDLDGKVKLFTGVEKVYVQRNFVYPISFRSSLPSSTSLYEPLSLGFSDEELSFRKKVIVMITKSNL